jgi:hypothetical protein
MSWRNWPASSPVDLAIALSVEQPYQRDNLRRKRKECPAESAEHSLTYYPHSHLLMLRVLKSSDVSGAPSDSDVRRNRTPNTGSGYGD